MNLALFKGRGEVGLQTVEDLYQNIKNIHLWDFPGGPVAKTSPSNAGGAGSIPGGGAKIPCASRPKDQTIKQKQYCTKFSKDSFKKIFLGSFPSGSDGKESACNAGDLSLVSRLRKSPGEENGYPLECSYLENPMDRGA